MTLHVRWFGTTASIQLPEGTELLSPPERPGLEVGEGDGPVDLAVALVPDEDGIAVIVAGELHLRRPTVAAAWIEAWRELELQVAARSADPVFIHAGAVAIAGQGIVLPGPSGVGKTTLVLHLVEALGAVYYSDEYALLDRNAYLHPYARDPHVRSEAGGRGIPTPLSSYTDRVGAEPIRVAGVILCHRATGAMWAPTPVPARDCALALLENAVGARTQTPAVMDAVAAVAGAGWCVKGVRDRLSEVSGWVETRLQMS